MKVGLVKELEGNIFDFGEHSSANLMHSTQIKIAHYIGHKYGGDIMGELQTKQEFVVPPAEYPPTSMARAPAYEAMIKSQQINNLARLE